MKNKSFVDNVHQEITKLSETIGYLQTDMELNKQQT